MPCLHDLHKMSWQYRPMLIRMFISETVSVFIKYDIESLYQKLWGEFNFSSYRSNVTSAL
jgi:hypothetical protein